VGRKLLLGNGISARIFSFYNPEYLCVAPEAESQTDVPEFQFSMIVTKSRAAEELFCDLDVPVPKELDIPIGYCLEGVYCHGSPPAVVRKSIMEKKLSGMEKPSSSIFQTEDMLAEPYLSKNKDVLCTYVLSLAELVRALQTKTAGRDRIKERAVAITDTRIITESGKSLEYSHIVSTIPAPAFWEIYQGKGAEKKVFHSFPFYAKRMKRHLWDAYGYPPLPEMTMCYFSEPKYPFDRVRVCQELQGDEVAIEGPVPFDGAVELKGARIFRSFDNIAPQKVMFLGRYATWNPDVLMTDVIRKSAQKYAIEDIWSDQKAFNKHFVTYVPDPKYIQSTVKNYVLHLVSEVFSLLGTINWKIDDPDDAVKLDREKILEEAIDVFKFWISIAHMFGFSVDDVVRMYWEKSKKVEGKYAKHEMEKVV